MRTRALVLQSARSGRQSAPRADVHGSRTARPARHHHGSRLCNEHQRHGRPTRGAVRPRPGIPCPIPSPRCNGLPRGLRRLVDRCFRSCSTCPSVHCSDPQRRGCPPPLEVARSPPRGEWGRVPGWPGLPDHLDRRRSRDANEVRIEPSRRASSPGSRPWDITRLGEEAMDVSPNFRPLQRGAAASADRMLVVSLCSCHDEDHGLGDRYGVISEPFVVAAEQRDVDRLLDAVRPVA